MQKNRTELVEQERDRNVRATQVKLISAARLDSG